MKEFLINELKRVMAEKCMTQHELALRTGRPEKTMSEILHGKCRITAETAIQFEYVLGLSASYWLTLQMNIDMKKAEDKRNKMLPMIV